MARVEENIDFLSDPINNDISCFVEELYTRDYDLLILMARKFYNLFMLFHELDLKKSLILKFPLKNTGKIVTDLALPLLKKELQNSVYKKIIIADDIMIHGRGIRNVYDRLKDWNPDLDIRVITYLRNDEDTVFYKDIMERISSWYVVASDKWKMISDHIVSTFYQTGRPYISYLPYFVLDTDWSILCDRFNSLDCFPIENELMTYNQVEGFIYTGAILQSFSDLPWAKICALRFYYYKKINKILMVPYFCMSVLKRKSLEKLSSYIREHFLSSNYQEQTMSNSQGYEVCVRELEYVFSTWMAWMFLYNQRIKVLEHHYDAELYSFGTDMLLHDEAQWKKVSDYLSEILNQYDYNDGQTKMANIPVNNQDINILIQRYSELKEKYKRLADDLRTKKQWNGSYSMIGRFIEELLSVNGTMDEERYKENRDKIEGHQQKRLLGIPLDYLLNDLTDFLQSVDKDNDLSIQHIDNVFANVISVIDSGKGSVITRVVEDSDSHNVYNDSVYNESLLHAGEQNYVFYEKAGFPYIYGLYLLEKKKRWKLSDEQIKRSKQCFGDKYRKYLDSKGCFYCEEELQEMEKINFTRDYGEYLQQAFYRYKDNHFMIKAVEMALNITTEDCYGD